MKNIALLLSLFMCANCSTIEGWFKRHKEEPVVEAQVAPKEEEAPKRTTRRSIEEESMLGEQSGSLWSSRGQSAFLFTNNNQRLIGDPLIVNIDGYPKEQVQMKVNTIAKLVSQILNDKKQEIKLKEEKENPPPTPATPPADAAPAPGGAVQQRGLASTGAGKDAAPPMSPENEKALRKLEDEAEEIKQIQSSKDFIIRSVNTRVVEIQKDGNYKVKGEKQFMIGKREYKLTVSGMVRAEDFNDKGVGAETLMEASFDVNSTKPSEDL